MAARAALISDANFQLSVAVTTTESAPNGGQVDLLNNTTVFNVPVTVVAVADAPTASGPASFSTEEDTAVSISALGGALTDIDGSETLSFRIESVPAGTSFSAGTNEGGGVWSFTESQLASLSLTPPDDWHGTINMQLIAVATEGSNSDTEETSRSFSVVVDAEADAPTVNGGSNSTNEDVDVLFGNQISYTLGDTDGSENVTQVDVTGLSGDAGMSYVASGAAVVTAISGGYRITGTPAEIRATLDTFTYSPATHVGDDVNLTVAVTVEDADGSTATQTGTHTIDITPVADSPTVSGDSVTTDEDVAVAVDLSGGLVDLDGSETISYQVTGVPAGASFSAGTDQGSGVWSFTTAQLSSLMFNPPAQAHGTYNMVLRATATEAEGDTATSTSPLVVNVNPILDPPVLNDGSTTANEDATILVGSDIDLTTVDVDGSQTMQITLSGIPAGSTVDWNTGLPGTVTPPAIAGGDYVISGTTPQALALLDTLTVQPPANTDDNFTIGVSVYAEEAGGANTTVTGNHQVIVEAVADAPNLTLAATSQGNEDTSIALPLTLSLNDTDGSETIQYVDIAGIPTGATLNVTSGGGVTTSSPATGTIRFTGSTADLIAKLASGISITPPLHSDVDIPLTITARATESNPTETEVDTLTADTVLNVTVQVDAVADGITAVGGSFATEEDTQVALSGLAGNGVDTDGSEVVTFRMLGVPSGASFASGTDAGGGVWTFTAAQVTAGLAFTPPANEHGTYNMTLEATTTEQNGGDNQVSTAAVTVVVDAEADRPTVNGTAVGNEDTTITFGNQFNVNLVDNDGSETLTQLVVTMPGTETATYTAQGGASVVVSGQDYTITGTQTDIQATLDTFAWTPPTHSDDNIIVGISATTQDADGSTATRNSNRTIRVRAVADEPGGSASSISGTEDTPITLDINVTASADTDGSESYSVRLFDIPDGSIVAGSTTNGVTYTQSGSDWIVAAPTLAALNTALSSATYRPPTDFSGTINAQVEIISTEGATGNEVAVQTASVTRPFDIEINQVADAPELRVVDATAGAAGLEDTPIRLQVDVRLADDDGSEVLSDVTISNIPAGARITNAAGVTLGTDLGGGEVRVTSAQLAQLHVIAPPNSNDNFQLTISASSEESNQGLTGDGDTEIGTATIDVAVIGVADPANITPSPISVAEDTTIPLGTAVGASLADADGSESLFFVIEGLPAGITPSAGSFIGGRWQVDAADMPTLTIPGRPNFSGDYVADYATGLRVLAVTQEDDGHQTTVQVPLSITVTPVVDAQTWSPSVTVTEGNDIPLSSVAPGGLIDGDGSEEIVSYTFNLNSLISDAGIAVSGGTTQNFIDNHINGTFTDNGNGTITVSAANLPGVSFDAAAFTDSNRDFTVPVDVLFTDGAASQTVSRTFSVNLVGDADTPTVFANNVSGNDNTPLALSLGGTTTDTDAAQGQAVSESIYYIVSGFADPGADVLLTDAAGDPIGFNNQDGTWVLQPSDLANLHIMGIRGTGGSKTLTVTTIATENDGDVAMNSTTFTVSITNTGGPGSPQAPLPPVVTINPMTVDEDGTIALDADIQSNPGDPTTGLDDVTVVISNVPAGVTVQGAIFNNVTGSWVSNAANVNAGNVTFTPVGDFSGTITPTVTAIATNGNQLTASNANNPAPITVTAVADPASISVSGSGNEDSAIALNISVTSQDTDGSETLVEPIRVTISAGTLSAGTDVGGGVWELTEAELSGLTLTPPANSDADISVSVQATMREPNGDTETATQAATVTVAAVADQAALTVSNASGNEDAAIALTGLSAALVDTDGSETLSTTITGVPEGSILSAGANNGDGSWTIAPGDLAGLSITPPMNWSGTMNLQLVGFTLEDSGATSQISQAFTVTVVPQADPVVFAALPQTAAAGASVNLGLNLQPGDATGTGPGENPAETVTVNLQASTDFVASVTGGTLTRVAAGHWRFTGTAAQGNTLAVQAFGEARDIDITVGVNATDGASVGAVTSVTLPLEVTGSASTLTGDGTANTLSGGAGADLIIGGGGSDALTGGLGADLFVWKAGDTSGGAVDTISDFNASEDVLDLGDLIPSYDPATDAVADYITLVENAGNTTIRIDTTGSGTHSTDVVELTGETGLDLATLITSGALVP
ncbi:MAG: type I secretion C-terminal target domain-containing protein [Pseudomonadota bacterium]